MMQRHSFSSLSTRMLSAMVLLWLVPGCDDGASEKVPAPVISSDDVWFEDVTQARGVDFIHRSGHQGTYLIPEIMVGGVAVFDMEGDGDLDLYLVQSGSIVDGPGPSGRNVLYANQGDGTFMDVTQESGTGDEGYGIGVATGDVDNDGDVDLLVTNLGRNALLLNDGQGRFVDATLDAGLDAEDYSASASFFDADADGDLDLFVCNYLYWSPEREQNCVNSIGEADYCAPMSYNSPAADRLYLNDGSGRFTDISESSGVALAPGTALGVVAMDVNSDGRQDVFVANDGMPDHLWMNQGDGVFVENALRAGCATDISGKSKAGMGIATGDLNHDGQVDLMVCNLWRETDSLYLIDANGNFEDATIRSGLAALPKTFTRFGLGFHDFDNDGNLDLYEANGRVALLDKNWGDDPYGEPNLLFRGSASGRFKEVTPRSGTLEPANLVSRGAAYGDFDNDGGVDIVVINRDGPPQMLRNIVDDRGNWVKFRVLDPSGRDAHGATVTLKSGDKSWTTVVHTDGSYCAASDPRVHFGIGAIDTVDEVEVLWPDGRRERFGSQPVNRISVLRSGDSAGAN